MSAIESYTVAITSCGRFNLLQRTLDSLFPRLEGPIAKVIIVEDSGNSEVIDVVHPFCKKLQEDGYLSSGKFFGEGIEVIINKPPLGLLNSIDRLYSKIETGWIFHCEDDWEFYGEGFIEKSFVLMKAFSNVSTVIMRDTSEVHFLSTAFEQSGIRFKKINPGDYFRAGVCNGITFNPGLRRMSDYRIVGSYADITVRSSEWEVAQIYQRLGYEYIAFYDPSVRHIGSDSHVPDQVRNRAFIPKLKHSIHKRTDRIFASINSNHDPYQRGKRRQLHRRAQVVTVKA